MWFKYEEADPRDKAKASYDFLPPLEMCREVWLGFGCSFISSYSLYSSYFLFIWFLFYLRHLSRTPKMANFISTELKNTNPGCYLSMWRSLKPRANSEKLIKSFSTEYHSYFSKDHQRAAVSSASQSTFFLFSWVHIAGGTGTLISDLKGKWFLQGSVLRIPDSLQELEDSCTLQKRCWTGKAEALFEGFWGAEAAGTGSD